MRRIKEKAARLRRYPRGRGFGVQSPNDYNFITKVVKGHIDSDCCVATDRNNADVRSDNYKFVHLCYRVAQYLQPLRCTCITMPGDNVESYVEAAVPGCIITNKYDAAETNGRSLVILSPAEDYVSKVEKILATANDTTWMIVEGIRRNEDTLASWNSVVEDSRTRITFDLYHYGIICFDRKRYKQNYKIYL